MKIWDKIRKIGSSNCNVLKYVFEKRNAIAEAVLYKYQTFEDRTVICCSTQSGCPIGCRFCGAGDYFVRSLSSEEIISQPVHLLADHGINPALVKRLQIMFMSMGEPLLNFNALSQAIYKLAKLYPQASLLVSTSAPKVDFEPMIKLSREVETVGLQFSIHESTDEARNALVPFKKKLTLREIAAVGVNWHAATGRRPFFNYCAHDKNTTAPDADRLVNLFDPAVWEATISVICERDESIAAANERQRGLATSFQAMLLNRGYSTRVFDPAGQDDIGGGCGQLWFVQNWMQNNPSMAKPSIGSGLPTIHAPA